MRKPGIPGARDGTGGMHDIRLGFRVKHFYREEFVHLYDELSSPGNKSSRSELAGPDEAR
jgi:hypothetical protein